MTRSAELADVDPYFVESSGISSNRGPQVITRNVLQDSKGGFWLATWHGVIRFDGTTFTNVTNKEGLRRYRAFSLLEDHQDNIWLGTTGAGLYRYDGETYTNFTTKDGSTSSTCRKARGPKAGWSSCRSPSSRPWSAALDA